ncbi:MAG: hypothetical protein RIH33_12200 [Marinoscillum sp.]|uniref:hypothetical protein n=1 Tax=Marinoscillum sp. TaxID=2024838 RepID=UPI0032F5C5EE
MGVNTLTNAVGARVLALGLFGFGFATELLRSDLPFLPFIGFFDTIPIGAFNLCLGLLLIMSALGVLFNIRLRTSSLLLGLTILVSILSCKPLYSTSITLISCLLILIGLGLHGFLLRLQLSIVYFGASVNKLADNDWWNGAYFDFFATDIFHLPFYETIGQLFPGHLTFAKILGVTTILIELALAMLFLIRRSGNAPILLGILFHGFMLVWTKGELSVIYFYVMSIAYLLVYMKENESNRGLAKVFLTWNYRENKKIRLTYEHATYLSYALFIGMTKLPKIYRIVNVLYSDL